MASKKSVFQPESRNTEGDNIGFICFWKIENFSFSKYISSIRSPKFKADILNKSEWFLSLDFNDSDFENCIYLEKCDVGDIEIALTVSLLKGDGTNHILFEEDSHRFRKKHMYGCELYIEELNLLTQEADGHNGSLLLMCHMWNSSTRTRTPSQCSILTHIERFKFELPITGFTSLKKGDILQFPLSCVLANKSQLHMEIRFLIDSNGYFLCEIRKTNKDGLYLNTVLCKIFIVAKEGSVSLLTTIPVQFPVKQANFLTGHFAKKLDLNFTTAPKIFDLTYNKLVLCCEFVVPDELVLLKHNIVVDKEIKTEDSLSETIETNKTNYLLQMFKESKFSFVTLRTANKEFVVHKALLCSKSQYFVSLFKKSPSSSDFVDVDDADNDTISLMLKYLHLDTLENLDGDAASKLHHLADKYQMDELKSICAPFMKTKVTLENVCELFLISDANQDDCLELEAQKFFNENSKFILRSKEWNAFLKNKTELAVKVLENFAEKS